MTFLNKEGDPGHKIFDLEGYHQWLNLFILYKLFEFHLCRNIDLIINSIFSCIMKTETLDSDMIRDENLPEYWDALKGDD